LHCQQGGEIAQRVSLAFGLPTRDKKKGVAEPKGSLALYSYEKSPQIEGEHASFASGCVELLPLLEEPVVCSSFMYALSSYLFLKSHEFFVLVVLAFASIFDHLDEILNFVSQTIFVFGCCQSNHKGGRSETKLIRTLVYLW